MTIARPGMVLAMLLALAGATPAFAEQAADPRTLREAEITAQQIEREVARMPLTRERRVFPDCPLAGSTHERFRDASGITRRYTVEMGSDDSHAKFTYLYDRAGRLRLVVVDAGAVNGTRRRDRIVLALDGSRLSERSQRLAGPGYPWVTPWPDSLIVRNPDQVFAAQTRCGVSD